MFKKIDVNNEKRHELYKFLAANTPGFAGYIEWNFAKFLVDSQGLPIKYYSHTIPPNDILPDIIQCIEAHG